MAEESAVLMTVDGSRVFNLDTADAKTVKARGADIVFDIGGESITIAPLGVGRGGMKLRAAEAVGDSGFCSLY